MASLLLTAAIFGFFYAHTVSVMWGLDATTPQAAILAMQGINATIRNAAFFPAFFLPPLALAITAALALRAKARATAFSFALAAVLYGLGGIALTATINIPMNNALALVSASGPDAPAIWQSYSDPWQMWNFARTIASGLAVLLAGWGLITLPATRC